MLCIDLHVSWHGTVMELEEGMLSVLHYKYSYVCMNSAAPAQPLLATLIFPSADPSFLVQSVCFI